VTLAFALRREIEATAAIAYAIAQVVGDVVVDADGQRVR
jgi:glycerol uptake facilitator-like aquaporin